MAAVDGEGNLPPTEKSQEVYVSTAQTRAANTAVVTAVATDFPDVVLYVTVNGANGQPVSGLTRDDFQVFEKSPNEVGAALETLTCFQEEAGASGITFALTFDLSTTMNDDGRLAEAKLAASQFLASTNQKDRASLVTFSGCDEGGVILPVDGVTADRNDSGSPDIQEAIAGLYTLGRTALYDGIADAVESIRDEPFPKGVIVFTDGNSNADCHYSITSVIALARAAGIPVYTIGLSIEPGGNLENRLIQIATETDGTYTLAPKASDMAAIYQDIAQNIRSQYRLCYTSHNPTLDGTTRTVTVTSDGRTGTDTFTVASVPTPPVNRSPVANAGLDQVVDEGILVTLDGSGSSDPDEDALTYTWRQTSGALVTLSDVTAVRPSFTAPAVDNGAALLTFDLTVTDPLGQSSTDTVNIAVRNVPVGVPTAEFTWAPEPQIVSLPVTFTDASTPASAPIVSRSWDFGDGATSTALNPQHVYAAPGTYDVRLTVTDSNGSSHTVSHTVTITQEDTTTPTDPEIPGPTPCTGGDCGGGSGGCFIQSLLR